MVTPVEIGILLVSWVFFLSLGFVLGFYWLKTQLESKMAGMFDMDLSQELDGLGGDLEDEF